MNIVTTRFGLIHASESDLIRIPEGLVGFRSFTQYVHLLDPVVAGLTWLQSVTVPELSLADLTNTAAAAVEPAFIVATTPKLGGVDPLGLRQISFDLMDQVIPGLNNVARHIRPFVVVTWAWRRAQQLAKARGADEVLVDELRDFVDRIEVIYAWSQFLRNPDADLPGRQVLAPLLRSDRWFFGGNAWRKRRAGRPYWRCWRNCL